MTVRIAAFAGFAIALVIAACGDGEPEAPLAPEVYGERYKALNSEAVQRMNQASAELGLKLETSQFTLEVVDEYIEAISSTFENFGDGIDDLEPLAVLKADQDRLVEATAEFVATTDEALERSRQADLAQEDLRVLQDVQAALEEYLVVVNAYCIAIQEADFRANLECGPPSPP